VVKKLFICPPDFGTDETCRTLTIPSSQQWLGIFNNAILTLANTYNYEQLNATDLTPEECAARVMLIYADYLQTDACPVVQSPYWDDETDNEIEMGSDTQIWYGAVTDWLAPIASLNFQQNLAVWALTGFVGYAAGLGSAIFFRTAAKRFVLAFESSNVEEIIRIIIDSASFNATIPASSGIVEIVVLGDDALSEHDLYIIQGEA